MSHHQETKTEEEQEISSASIVIEEGDDLQAQSLAKIENKSQSPGAMDLIEKIALQGGDVSALEAVIRMHNTQQDREQKREFEAAFTRMQADLPAIAATRHNKQTDSKYAKLADIQKIVKPILRQHGFSTRYESPDVQPEGLVVETCVLAYENGYSIRNTESMPVDSKGIAGKANKTETHGTGSAVSYARRYALCGILDIAIADDDGNAAGGEPRITQAQQNVLLKMLADAPDYTEQDFYSAYADVKDVPVKNFNSAIQRIKQDTEKANAAGNN